MTASKLESRTQNSSSGAACPVVVSQRGPLAFDVGAGGAPVPKPAPGGLATTIGAAAMGEPLIWIAAPHSPADAAAAPKTWLYGQAAVRLVPLPADPGSEDGGLANPVLWFLQHGLADSLEPWRFDAQRQHLWAEEYRQANAALVGAAVEIANASVFLLQDYHLYLAPALLRQQRPAAPIAHFSHIPWPRCGAWECLAPDLVRSLLHGLLGADLLGFQTAADAANFAATCVAYSVARPEGTWLRGADGHATLLRNYPVTVDAPSLFSAAATQGRLPALGERSGQVILRVDRLDPSKNIPAGFAAFGRLLDMHPELRGRVEFVSHLVCTRENVPEYRAARDAVRDAAEQVNARFGTASWQPIRIMLGDDRQLALAELRRFDVLLANSLADGMNLVAKEGAVLNERDGVLVLSERAGAWVELGGWALGVDPTDIDQTARALHQALVMPRSERMIRARRLRHAVASTSSVNWLNRQVLDTLSARAANAGASAQHRLLVSDTVSRLVTV